MRTRRSFLLGLMLVSILTGCSMLQYLPFLKKPVDTSPKGTRATTHGSAFALVRAARRWTVDTNVDWSTYNNTYSGQRYSPLTQITTVNVSTLRHVCTFDTGEQTGMQSGPVIVGGILYLTTATATYAVDAARCALVWKHRYAYSPGPDFDLKVNRGVAYLDTPDGPRLYRGANDGRVYAIDARTGDEVWNVLAGDVSNGESFPAAPIAWHGVVYIGNAGGDNFNVTGRMMAFDARTGALVWSFSTIPSTGPANATWPAETNRVPRAGGTTWTSYALDTLAGTVFLSTGNAAPDFLASVRPGQNQHAYSVIGLDAHTGELRHAQQLLPMDFHDWDVAAAPVLFSTTPGRSLVATGGKDGHLYGIDWKAGTILYATPVTTIDNVDAPLTETGTRFCPGVQGGVEWNGPAYSPVTRWLYVGSIDWCTTVRVAPPKQLKNKRGIPWTGSARLKEPFGVMDPVANSRGWLTAIDAERGTVQWRFAAPAPIVAGVTATAGGLVFAADLHGEIYAFDAKTGEIRFRYNTGQPVGGGIVSYAVDGRQYIAIASGLDAPKTWQTKSSPATVVVLGLP